MSDDLRELAIRALIACVTVTWLVVLWRGNRDPAMKHFSFQGLIMTRDGFIDRVAVMELGSWIVLSLVVIVLTANNKITEWLIFIYVAFPAVRAGQVSMQKAFIAAPEPNTTTTTTADSSKTVTRTVDAPKGKGK